MSNAEAKGRSGRPAEWDRLELAVRRLVDELAQWRGRAERAEAAVAEMDAALRAVSTGSLDPLALQKRTQVLEQENTVLQQRLEQARERVQRIVARLDFVQEDR